MCNMKAILKPAIVLGFAGALALGSMTPTEAAERGGLAAEAGRTAGAAIAGAAADANAQDYGPGYNGPVNVYDPNNEPAPNSYSQDEWRYSRSQHGYDTNYIGPWQERRLQGRYD